MGEKSRLDRWETINGGDDGGWLQKAGNAVEFAQLNLHDRQLSCMLTCMVADDDYGKFYFPLVMIGKGRLGMSEEYMYFRGFPIRRWQFASGIIV